MKKFMIAAVAATLIAAPAAFADVSGISAKFGGGCLASNKDGNCTIKVTANGTDLGTESAIVYAAADAKSAYNKVSSKRTLSDAGQVSIKVKNVAGGCYKVKTGPNGNDKPDHTSRAICE